MTLIAVCSGKGSPGVSTLACVAGAVWPHDRRIVIAECDPSGNDLAARFGMTQRVGMTSLVLAHRHSAHSTSPFDTHIQALPGGLEALVGPVNPDAAMSLDRELGVVSPTVFPEEVDVLVDCGRILSGAAGQQRIVTAADEVVVVTRPDAAGMAHTVWTLDAVRSLTTKETSSVVVVGRSQFHPKEMEQAFQAPILGHLPLDHRSAAMACGIPGKTKRFARSGLVSSMRLLVDRLSGEHGIRGEHQRRGADETSIDSTLDASRSPAVAWGEQRAGVGP